MTKLQKDLQTLMVEFNSLTDENSSYSILTNKYLPEEGQGENKTSQLVTAANNIIYGWYNNGDTISGDGNDLTSYANWIDRHIKEPEIRKILKDDHIDYNDTYYLSEIILPLIKFVFREDFLEGLAVQEAEGDIYECQGRIYN